MPAQAVRHEVARTVGEDPRRPGTTHAPRGAHTIWLMRRAAILEGTSADALDEPRDFARAQLFYRVAAKVSDAVECSSVLTLTASERTILDSEAQSLTQRATLEVHREKRDLHRSEEWLRTARAMREILESSDPGD